MNEIDEGKQKINEENKKWMKNNKEKWNMYNDRK